MRAREEMPLDPEIAAELEAIDAVLAGEPADPRFAAVAELALIVRSTRPLPDAAAAGRLDARVASRVRERSGARRSRRGLWSVAGSLAAALAVAIVIVANGTSPAPQFQNGSSAPFGASSGASSAAAPARRASAGKQNLIPPSEKSASVSGGDNAHRGANIASSASAPVATTPGPSAPTGAVDPFAGAVPTPGSRRQVDSAQLALSAPADRIDAVAQEAFAVAGTENGIVEHSTVTAGGADDSSANITLSVPESELAATMTRLSALRFASVVSRTDASQDVTGSFDADGRRLADARALRTSLLRQLADAVTQAQIDSLTARIHDAEATITRDEHAIASLTHQIDRSQIDLSIDEAGVPIAPGVATGGGGFTLHRALHDAGRVLVLTAGVILIGLAALVPVALLAALLVWFAALLRRRRREVALDAA